MGESAQSCNVLYYHLNGLIPFLFDQEWGDPGLHLLSRSVTQVITLFREDERNVGQEEDMGRCPNHKGIGTSLRVFRTLWVTSESFGMLWNEEPGLSFVWSEICQDASVLQLQSLYSARRCPERSWDFRRGEEAVFIHCSFSSALGVPSGIHSLVGRMIGSLLCLLET